MTATQDALACELAPWAAAARTEANAGLAALKLLQQVRPVAQIDGDTRTRGCARCRAGDGARVLHAVQLERRARQRSHRVRAALRDLSRGRPALRADARGSTPGSPCASDANAVDRLCRLALAVYEEWCAAPDSTDPGLRRRRGTACGADGTFDAGGTMTLDPGRPLRHARRRVHRRSAIGGCA